MVLLVPNPGLESLWPVAATAGLSCFLSNYVRSRGKHLEERLIVEWNGLPTTHLLRHSENDNAVMFRRRRVGLEAVFKEPRPSLLRNGLTLSLPT